MTLTLRYALKDLRGSLSSFRIVLLCLILGVGAISAVQSTSHSVLAAIQKNGRSLLGADILVRNIYNPAPSELRDWLSGRGAVLTETIEARAMVANAVTDDNTLIELKAVGAGYPLFGTVTTDMGDDLPALLQGNGALLDEALRERLALEVGDTIRLGSENFTVRAFITHEPDRVGTSSFGLAPRVMIGVDALQATGLLQPGSMIYYNLRVKLPEPVNLEATRVALEEAFPEATWRVRDSDNASPSITRTINRLMLFLTLVGLSALLIGGIGIGNGMRAHFQTRLKTIAIFKSLGAPDQLIEKIYLCQVAIIAMLGTVAGLAIGLLLPYAASPYLATVLPFPVVPHITWASLAVPLSYGLLVSFSFTLWPLGQAVGTSPLELFRSAISPLTGTPSNRYRDATVVLGSILGGLAISSSFDTQFAMWFVVGALASLGVFWGMGRLIAGCAGKIPVTRHPALRLGLRNLHRPGNATANTLISLGLGLTVMVSVTLIEMNLRQGIAQNLPTDAPAFFFLDIQGDQKDGFQKLLLEQPTANTLKLTPNLRGRIVSVKGIPAAEALVDKSESWLLHSDRGFTYTSELPAHSEITSGEWWPADYSGPPLVSVVEDVERGFNAKVGDEMVINILGRDITAKIANVRSVNWMNFTISYAITFAPGALENAPHSWLATVVADPSAENEIQKNIGKAYPNISMIRISESIEAAGNILGNIATAVRVTALVAIITGILVLSGSLAATRTQRLYDVVILKVLGVRNRTLMQGFLLEFGLLGLLAGGLSIALGSIVSWAVMEQLMDLGWQFYLWPALATGCAGLGLTMFIGWLITGKILATPAAEHLRNE
jgi:putative ABC transport system permease protein